MRLCIFILFCSVFYHVHNSHRHHRSRRKGHSAINIKGHSTHHNRTHHVKLNSVKGNRREKIHSLEHEKQTFNLTVIPMKGSNKNSTNSTKHRKSVKKEHTNFYDIFNNAAEEDNESDDDDDQRTDQSAIHVDSTGRVLSDMDSKPIRLQHELDKVENRLHHFHNSSQSFQSIDGLGLSTLDSREDHAIEGGTNLKSLKESSLNNLHDFDENKSHLTDIPDLHHDQETDDHKIASEIGNHILHESGVDGHTLHIVNGHTLLENNNDELDSLHNHFKDHQSGKDHENFKDHPSELEHEHSKDHLSELEQESFKDHPSELEHESFKNNPSELEEKIFNDHSSENEHEHLKDHFSEHVRSEHDGNEDPGLDNLKHVYEKGPPSHLNNNPSPEHLDVHFHEYEHVGE